MEQRALGAAEGERRERIVFVAAVLLATIGSTIVGLTASPPRPTPDYALASKAVWHVEVALALFIALYFAIMAVLLATHGHGFTKLVGPGGMGAEASEVARLKVHGEELWETVAHLQASTMKQQDSLSELEAAITDMQGTVADLSTLVGEVVRGR